MHLNKGYLGKKHQFVTKVSHHSLRLPYGLVESFKRRLPSVHSQLVRMCWSVFEAMMFSALKDAPQIKSSMFNFTKGHQPLLQGQNYFKENKLWHSSSLLCWQSDCC
jgi:hypothetical protein